VRGKVNVFDAHHPVDADSLENFIFFRDKIIDLSLRKRKWVSQFPFNFLHQVIIKRDGSLKPGSGRRLCRFGEKL
jgi:hypothetical protein